MILLRSENIRKIEVEKEKVCNEFEYYKDKTVNFYKIVSCIVSCPWWRFKKEEKIDNFVKLADGFYREGMRDEYNSEYWSIADNCFKLIRELPENSNKFIKGESIYYKPNVTFYFNDGYCSVTKLFDTYEEAVEYAMGFKTYGLNVCIEEDE
jgi:hypothetical protein